MQKTETISSSMFSSQILQNVEMNIVVHSKFWRKYGSVSHLCSCNLEEFFEPIMVEFAWWFFLIFYEFLFYKSPFLLNPSKNGKRKLRYHLVWRTLKTFGLIISLILNELSETQLYYNSFGHLIPESEIAHNLIGK